MAMNGGVPTGYLADGKVQKRVFYWGEFTASNSLLPALLMRAAILLHFIDLSRIPCERNKSLRCSLVMMSCLFLKGRRR
jgi:hypothetical protein